MKPHHVDPEEAVQIHEDVGAKTSIGIHWGTFKMTVEVTNALNYHERKREREGERQRDRDRETESDCRLVLTFR